MEKIIFQEDENLIDIRLDGAFKAVFTKNTPESTGALSNLVSALIGRNITIVTILANEPPIGNIRDRQLRLDINCRAENGELVNVEMCFNPRPFEPVRMEFHVTKLYTGQDIRGTDKDYKDLKQTYQIAILAQERFFQDEEFYHSFEYYDPSHNLSLNGRTRIISLELSKLKTVVEKPASEMKKSELWAVYLEYLTDRSKRSIINEIVEIEEGIAMASGVLLKVSRDEEERARIMRDEKIELDYQSEMTYQRRLARTEGREEGREEGRTESREQIAKNALGKGMSMELVHEITGLDIDRIKSIQAECG